MNDELNRKLNILVDSIRDSLNDIKKNGRKARELNKAVKDSRQIITEVLEQQLGGVSLEEQICISEIPDEDWLITAKHIMCILNDPFIPQNQYERYFLQFFDYIVTTNKEKLLENMKFSLGTMKTESQILYEKFIDYFSDYNFWGTFDPENADYDTFIKRVDVLKHHAYDFVWLYKKTEDYLSKRTLAAILMNWADLQTAALTVVKSIFRDYWEPDIFPNNKDDVLIDLGAYNGDSIKNYVEVYGIGYKKIYAYEISKMSCIMLKDNIEQWQFHDIEIRQRGAGAKKSKMYIETSEVDSSANKISTTRKKENEVEIVRLDDDIEDIPTFIKMDIEGSEQNALKGLARTISDHTPKMAICIYHGYDDIWKIPSMIDKMNQNYKFYIRHYGGDLIPTEFVLLCKSERE